jgi:nicotinamide-nucleotide amidase
MDEPAEVITGVLARQLNVHLAVAESCTGGLISHLLTNVPGSSEYFLGSVISYANQAKIHLLDVKPETLAVYGAVSRETVLEMARGVRQILSADIGISVSGIAGPGGNTPDKPIGTIWIGLSVDGMDRTWHFHFAGQRQEIKRQAAEMALSLLVDYLKEEISHRTVPFHDS